MPLNRRTLDEWIDYIQSIHFRSVDLTLDRTRRVLHRMKIRRPRHVITVAGTNGKGSTIALLEAIYFSAGYKVGAYTSPHLITYRERIRLGFCNVDEQRLVNAFCVVERARGDILLTYFEFGTLAALYIFQDEKVDIALLEVGLGGRLDAVNALTSDLSCITSIAIDHEAWLGRTRESIGGEKAGVLRYCGKSVINDDQPPCSVMDRARKLNCSVRQFGLDYRFEQAEGNWSWSPDKSRWHSATAYPMLPFPQAKGHTALQNAAGAVAIVESMSSILPVEASALCDGITRAKLPGRTQVLEGPVERVFDVAHNPAAVGNLASLIDQQTAVRTTHAVFSMLRDKNVAEVVKVIGSRISSWHLVQLESSRAMSLWRLRELVTKGSSGSVDTYPDPMGAYQGAMSVAQSGDRVIVFGSFYLVGAILKSLSEDLRQA